MSIFTTENIYKWKDVLASRLLSLPSSTYLQPYSFLMKGRQYPLLRALDANYQNVPPAQCIRVNRFKVTPVASLGISGTVSGSDFFEGGVVDKKLWETYAAILGYTGTKDVYDMLDYYFAGKLTEGICC